MGDLVDDDRVRTRRRRRVLTETPPAGSYPSLRGTPDRDRADRRAEAGQHDTARGRLAGWRASLNPFSASSAGSTAVSPSRQKACRKADGSERPPRDPTVVVSPSVLRPLAGPATCEQAPKTGVSCTHRDVPVPPMCAAGARDGSCPAHIGSGAGARRRACPAYIGCDQVRPLRGAWWASARPAPGRKVVSVDCSPRAAASAAASAICAMVAPSPSPRPRGP